MNRREFLVRMGGTLVAVPFVLEAIGCDDSTAPTDRWDTTSQPNGGHEHTVTFFCHDVTSNADVVYTSTTVSGHAHQVIVGLSALSTLAVGQPVDVTSEMAAGHNHVWSFRIPANHC